jgi:hypothetical protein
MCEKQVKLNIDTGFDKLVSYYQSNRDKPWHEWLELKTIFNKSGKQGNVGLMVAKDDNTIVYVFKISQYINYLVQHEFTVMKSLNPLTEYCPHFCKSVGGILCEVNPNIKKGQNPFENKVPHMIEKEVLLMEYLDKSQKFSNYIWSKKVDENILYSTVKQVLLALSIAQTKAKFTHYDLHSNNVMIKRCNRDLVLLYVLDEDNQFCVATRGYLPVIIDFGFSYAKELDQGPLWPSLGHTKVGFMSNQFDPVADPKLFLVTVADEIYNSRGSKNSKKFRNIVKNQYNKLKIDWGTGWDKGNDMSASDYLEDLFIEVNDGSKLFDEYIGYCIDVLQSLIILPLEKQDYSNITTSYITFVHEFAKIEREISSPFYCLYILKGIVDSARVVRSDYANKGSRKHSVDFFRQSLHDRINSVVQFCKPKDIHYERMLCSLLCLSKNMEGVFYEKITEQNKTKKKQYKKLPLKSVEEICAVIDINIEDDYVFNDKSVVMIIDCGKEKCDVFHPSEQQRNKLNSLVSISRGPELYNMISE